MALDYPRPRKNQTVEDWFGHQLADPYDYFRNAQDPEVASWVAAQNALTDSWFDQAQVAEKIDELKAARLPELYAHVAAYRDGYLASRPTDAGSYEFVLLDGFFHETGAFEGVPEREDFTSFQVDPCPANHDYVSVLGMPLGDPRPRVTVYNTVTGESLYEGIGTFSTEWSAGDGRLYASLTEADPKTQESHTVFEAFDPATGATERVMEVEDTNVIFGTLAVSSDGNHVLLKVCADYALASWYDYDVRTGELCVLTQEDVEWYYLDHMDGIACFVDMSSAANGAVISAGAEGTSELLPQSDSVILGSEGFAVGGELFVVGKRDVSRCLINVTAGTEVELPSTMGDLGVVGREDGRVFLRFVSFVDAPQVLGFDGSTLERLCSTSDATHPNVVVEQHFAPSAGDGTLIPYYLVRRADAVADGTSWALMYAYGGYNIDMPAWYTEAVTGINIADWVEAGHVYIQAGLRGGNEYGPSWHEAGMLMNKRHCYEDYIGVAEKVAADGWTSAGKIAITGCSNGGLLNSALTTMRPDLWGCVIDSVPHTDMIHFVDDDRGPMYITEYGNPRESKEIFEYLLSYSPYHNVREAAYPPVYVQTGECDNNVPPYHGKKFAAALQEANQADTPVLLRVLARGSHDRGGTPEEYWNTTAEMRLFIEKAMEE